MTPFARRSATPRSPLDRCLSAADNALRTLSGASVASRPVPVPAKEAPILDEQERRLAEALMRVNHVGEVCAQALYNAQLIATQDPALQAQFEQAAREEADHLAWTQKRLNDLNGRVSLLNPLWYAGAFCIGLAAGRAGKRWSLGFVVETERQVERHLAGHLDRLPPADTASRAVVEQMKSDESRHALDAQAAGGEPLPAPVRWLMRGAARVMTTTAHYI